MPVCHCCIWPVAFNRVSGGTAAYFKLPRRPCVMCTLFPAARSQLSAEYLKRAHADTLWSFSLARRQHKEARFRST